MTRRTYSSTKDYTKPYIVERYCVYEGWSDDEYFATKAEAVAYIRDSVVNHGDSPEDFNIRTQIPFTITWED